MIVEDISFVVCWVTKVDNQNNDIKLPKLLWINLIKEITCKIIRKSKYVCWDYFMRSW